MRFGADVLSGDIFLDRSLGAAGGRTRKKQRAGAEGQEGVPG
jgi:hypothetical protein